VFKKCAWILCFAILLNFTAAYAMGINVSKDSELHISVSDFVGEVSIYISRFNEIIYTAQNATGIFDVNLGEPLGTLDIKVCDSAGNSAETSVAFDSTTQFDNKVIIVVDTATPAPTVSPSPAAAVSSLEFTVGKKFFYTYSPKKTKHDMDVQTIFDESADRVLVPVRFFAETLGYNVAWDAASGGVTITSECTSVSMQKDSEYLIKNSAIIKMDEPLQIINDRTYMPIRFVGEAFGYNVSWDGASQTATLSMQ